MQWPTCSASPGTYWCISLGPRRDAACCGLFCCARGPTLPRCLWSRTPLWIPLHPDCATLRLADLAFCRGSRQGSLVGLTGSCCLCSIRFYSELRTLSSGKQEARRAGGERLSSQILMKGLSESDTATSGNRSKQSLLWHWWLTGGIFRLFYCVSLSPPPSLWRYCVFYFGNPGLVTPPAEDTPPFSQRVNNTAGD